jgi:hypothetical protein
VRFLVAKTDFRRGRDGPAVPVERGWRRSKLRTSEMRFPAVSVGFSGGSRLGSLMGNFR